MMSTQFARFFHLSTTRVMMSANKSNLVKLRKKTGYPFGNCKKALEANDNDFEKAEKWLEEQAKVLGWSKAMKMVNRDTPQGLVGVAWDKQYAAMVEVNCETDFVSKNEKFQKLVDLAAKTCLDHSKADNPSPRSISKVILRGEEVGNLRATDQQSLTDHVVKNVALVGERLVLRRAALISVHPSVHLSVHTHPISANNNGTMRGKYGAVLMYLASIEDEATKHLAKQLCQHVIGMNPATIEASDDKPPPEKPAPKEKTDVETEDEDTDFVIEGQEEETAMMRQTFLLDPDRTVAEVVTEAAIKIEDFVRFECGESLSEVEEISTKAAQVGG